MESQNIAFSLGYSFSTAAQQKIASSTGVFPLHPRASFAILLLRLETIYILTARSLGLSGLLLPLDATYIPNDHGIVALSLTAISPAAEGKTATNPPCLAVHAILFMD